jgi:hypothetical protein
MKNRIVLFFALFLLATGCLPTLHPLYHLKDLVFKPEFLGNWRENTQTDGMSWIVMRNDESDLSKPEANIYQIRMIQSNDTLDYAGGIIQLGEHYYLDLFLPNFETDAPMFHAHMYPVHTIWRFEYQNDSLTIRPFNSNWIRDLIKNNQIRIKNEETIKGLLITAGTDELQAFVEKYGADERVYDKPKVFVR